MAKRLKQQLQPGERILWQPAAPAGANHWMSAFATGALGSMGGSLIDTQLGATTAALALFLTLLMGRLSLANPSDPTMEMAITGERLLHINGPDATPNLTLLQLEEIQAIEVLGPALRVTLRDGSVHVVKGLQDAADCALALAHAARLAPPWVPGRKERLAEEAALLVAMLGGALALGWTLSTLGGDQPEAAGLLFRLGLWLAALPMAAIGCLLGFLAGIALVKPHLTYGEMRAWMRQCPFLAPAPEPGAKTGPLARLCLWFVELLYDASAPPNAQGKRHGR